MNIVKLVVLAHYPDIFQPFYETANKYEPDLEKILVWDGSMDDRPLLLDRHWTIVEGVMPFIYSRNVNIGWNAAAPHDVILCGDDVRFTSPFSNKLQEVAYNDPTIGISVPELGGQSPFVCGYFKREMLDATGPMDESFIGYGHDDNWFCVQMERRGYRTQPTREVIVEHAPATTFYRREKEGAYSVSLSCEINRKRFEEKIGREPNGGVDRWQKP